jgi:hypothetical protein
MLLKRFFYKPPFLSRGFKGVTPNTPCSFIFNFEIQHKPYQVKIEWDGRTSSLVKARDRFFCWFVNNWTIPWANNKLHIKLTDDEN